MAIGNKLMSVIAEEDTVTGSVFKLKVDSMINYKG